MIRDQLTENEGIVQENMLSMRHRMAEGECIMSIYRYHIYSVRTLFVT